jgi:hypothetical protein
MEDTVTLNGINEDESAVHLKELGNHAFKEGHYDKAITLYSKAIGYSS